jgi:hypothetical protein
MSGPPIVNRKYQEFPSEPPVATLVLPNGAERARARASAAKRTLAGEHRSAIHTTDGRRSGNSFPLVSSELCLRLPCAVWVIPPEGSLQEGFRLESWRCYLSHGLG